MKKIKISYKVSHQECENIGSEFNDHLTNILMKNPLFKGLDNITLTVRISHVIDTEGFSEVKLAKLIKSSITRSYRVIIDKNNLVLNNRDIVRDTKEKFFHVLYNRKIEVESLHEVFFHIS